MIFQGRSVDAIRDEEFEQLVTDHAREGQHLEFKATFDHKSNDARLELLLDVASLANGGGGYLVIGIRDDGTGRAQCFERNLLRNAASVARAIQSLCNAHISERIAGLEVRVRIVAGHSIVVVWVPPSSRRPHMVTLDFATHFRVRSDDAKREMTIGEIREAFMADAMARKLDELSERVAQLAPGTTLTEAIRGFAEEVGEPILRRLSASQISDNARQLLTEAEIAEEPGSRELYQQALAQSLECIQAVPDNPQHYYLAGIAYAGVGDVAGADSMFTRATELYPEYAADVEAAREGAWARYFNAAIDAYNVGKIDKAVQFWEQANQIYNKRPEGFFNLAAVYTQDEQYDKAAAAYREALAALERAPSRELTPEEVAERAESKQTAMTSLGQLLIATDRFPEAEQLNRTYLQENPTDVSAQSNLAVVLAKQGKKAEAMQTYESLLTSPNITANDVFSIGVGLFQIEEHARAADAFRRATEMSPNNRDAWYNYANALYAQEKWNEVIPVAQRLLQIDPLNENAALILARAYRDTKQNREALRVLEATEAAPVFVNNLQLRTSEGRSTVRGTVEPKSARAGTPVQLRFTFFGPSGELGTQTVTVTATAAGATANFEAVLQNPTPATGYRYEVEPSNGADDLWSAA